jgi:hypothetical protein
MSEVNPEITAQTAEKANTWITNARKQLEAVSGDSSDDRFLEQMERGLALSPTRVTAISELLDYRDAFYDDTGIDITIVQFYTLKSILPKY